MYDVHKTQTELMQRQETYDSYKYIAQQRSLTPPNVQQEIHLDQQSMATFQLFQAIEKTLHVSR